MAGLLFFNTMPSLSALMSHRARYVRQLMAEAPPVVWMVQGGSGLGNGLWGFVLAFAQSLLAGRALLVASAPPPPGTPAPAAGGPLGTLPSDFLCDAMRCQFPRVDVTRAEKASWGREGGVG